MYKYHVNVDWIKERRTKVKIKKYELEVDSPPEFKGPEGTITPEELLPSALASCLLTTFLEFKDKLEINLYEWSSSADAVLSPSPEKGFKFDSISIHVKLKVDPQDKEKVPKAIELAKKYCIISRAIKNNIDEKVDFEFIE
ncbi:MAG: OsmC family protein [Candidatus Thermoplasmatota archaeon]|jgi:organic hydroperoxide reductase OsmC/OhrA|nr:OsmC family protein [Candidatus Thermoplasmatota archaeon]MCL5963552.1 OsmC family protein [Candidatus Thermoplasmatota archaeon]